ncbi:uncharacterized protein LOC111077571 [Drosophila obscura]|uniref:uncharacterized protein LOC111077571 n=1 Tax=Drosophila obscura TaxID=7282 RepID=UPI001BB27A57|nr:uncharacterized protein LOC111077571 [Drosophila obscura]
MKLPFRGKLILLALLFLGSLLVRSTSSRNIPDEKPSDGTESPSEIPVGKKVNATDWAKVRRERGEPVEEVVAPPLLPQYPYMSSIKHLARTNSSGNSTNSAKDLVPFDFDSKHLPCDMDSGGIESVVWAFPNYCVWAYNNKYNDEKSYRIYKIYQLEGFFFGQYYERLKRFEMDPRVWDYQKTGVT